MNRIIARATMLCAVATVPLTLAAPSARAECGLAPPSDGETAAEGPATLYYGGSPEEQEGFVGFDADRAGAEAGGSNDDGAYARAQAARTVFGEASASPEGGGVCINDWTPPESSP